MQLPVAHPYLATDLHRFRNGLQEGQRPVMPVAEMVAQLQALQEDLETTQVIMLPLWLLQSCGIPAYQPFNHWRLPCPNVYHCCCPVRCSAACLVISATVAPTSNGLCFGKPRPAIKPGSDSHAYVPSTCAHTMCLVMAGQH